MTETRGSTEPRTVTTTRPKRSAPERKSLIARLGLVYRQVVSELRKVVWPTRNELVTYTTVVIVFVGVIMAVVSLLDFGFSKAVIAVFG
jgi:preprotein translocase subunit SecE